MVILSFLFLVLPVNWLFSMIFAAVFHELCHYVSIRMTGNEVVFLTITGHGMVMQTTPLSAVQECLCALAGPMGSMLLFLCYPVIPRISICAGVQGVFNLLPVYPLDGGRIINALLGIFLSEHIAKRICSWIEWLVYLLIFTSGLLAAIYCRLGILPVFVSMIVVFRGLSEKFLAKRIN